ncbi:MAG TPA: LCP family protein [Acidimicrobiales bacterium]|nr:LCP family protein [Acidimicrobiales bacterium]
MLIGLNIFVAMCLLLTAGGYAYIRYRFGQINKIDLKHFITGGGHDDPGQPMNVLLVGLDSRAGLSVADQAKYGTLKDSSANHTDTIMVLHIDPKAQKAAILSIPRDLYIPISGSKRKDRINTAIQGPNKEGDLINTIKQDLGIDINHYAAVDFEGFKGIVDAVGGVVIPFTSPARDSLSGLKVPTAGCITLNGDQALAFARSRHYEYFESGRWRSDPTGDLGRIQRQQEFMRRMLRRAISQGIRNPFKLNSLIGAITGHDYVTIDNTLSTKDLLNLGKRFKSLEPDQVDMLSLGPATQPANVGGASVLLPKQSDVQDVIDKFLGTAGTTTPTKVPNIAPNLIRVRVLNGSGYSGQASKVATGLKDAGFLVADTGDAHNFSYNDTEIRYGSGQRDKALVLQSYVQGGSKIVQDNTIQGVDLIITSGTNFGGIKASPTASTTTTTAPATTATTKPASKGAPAQLAC